MEIHIAISILWFVTGLCLAKLLINNTQKVVEEQKLEGRELATICTVTVISVIVYSLFGPIILAIQSLNVNKK